MSAIHHVNRMHTFRFPKLIMKQISIFQETVEQLRSKHITTFLTDDDSNDEIYWPDSVAQ
jgi:hypothetical protein